MEMNISPFSTIKPRDTQLYRNVVSAASWAIAEIDSEGFCGGEECWVGLKSGVHGLVVCRSGCSAMALSASVADKDDKIQAGEQNATVLCHSFVANCLHC